MAATNLFSPAPSPQNKAIPIILRNKHHFEGHLEICEAREETTEVAGLPQLPGKNSRLRRVEIFRPPSTHATLMHACPRSGPSPSARRYRRLQAPIFTLLVEDLAAFVKTVFSSGSSPDLFLSLRARATLMALGKKARPIA